MGSRAPVLILTNSLGLLCSSLEPRTPWPLELFIHHKADTPEKLNPSILIAGTTVPVTKRLE
jgi:hypothetical protein